MSCFIAGSPLEINVSDPTLNKEVNANGPGLYQSRLNQSTTFVINTMGFPTNEFDVVVTGPQGSAVPVRCYQLKNGNLLPEFMPTVTGNFDLIYFKNAFDSLFCNRQ